MSRTILFVVLCLVVSLIAPALVSAETRETERVEISADILKEGVTAPENGIPHNLLNNATGIAIFPNVIRAGLIVAGRYGTGILIVREKDGSWSNPSFITITGGSIGWQIGVEAMDIILVFKNDRSINRILTGKFSIGADASVAAGPVGVGSSAATDIQLKSEIYSYSRNRGLFAGLSIEGSALQSDDDANEGFYGRGIRTPKDIIGNKELKAPAAAEKLRKLVTDYTSR